MHICQVRDHKLDNHKRTCSEFARMIITYYLQERGNNIPFFFAEGPQNGTYLIKRGSISRVELFLQLINHVNCL